MLHDRPTRLQKLHPREPHFLGTSDASDVSGLSMGSLRRGIPNKTDNLLFRLKDLQLWICSRAMHLAACLPDDVRAAI